MNIQQALPQIIQRAKMMEQRKNAPRTKQDELEIVPPVTEHKQTFILLHGRGDEAKWFGGGLLDSKIPTYEYWHIAFPNAKFLFPQAPVRACARQTGFKLTQWFDMWGYDTLDPEKEELKVEGLKETTKLVHDLVRSEIELVGASNVVIGGLSNGCAASMIAFLTWTGEPLGGYLGMCGHLPFRVKIEEIANKEGKEQGAINIVKWLRAKIALPDIEVNEAVFQQSLAFTAHGGDDQIVPTKYGRDAANCLKLIGANSLYKEYPGLGHWYSDTMLEDFIRHFKANVNWVCDSSATETHESMV